MTLGTYETLNLALARKHVLLVTLSRPEAANAMNTQLSRDVTAVFEGLALDADDVRCVVVTGEGEKAFCAGGDLKERKGMTDEAWGKQHVVFERMVRALIDCPIPMLGAVNGAAYGGGCEILSLIHISEPTRPY